MSAKQKTATVAAPTVEAKKPAPEGQGFQEQASEFETASPIAMRQVLADPGRMSQTDIRTAQRAYGNQFVQRLARGTTLRGVRNTRLERGGKTPVQLSGEGGGAVHSQVESRIESQRGGGAALPEHTQNQMSESFGADFSNVRVHTGGESNELNRSLNARAFTTGNDVFFADNEYNPDSSGGQELLAHELTHVVQQGGAPAKSAAQTKRAGEDGQVATKPLQRGMAEDEQEQLLTKRIEGALQRQGVTDVPVKSVLASHPIQRGMADMEDESLLATKPVQRGMADMEDESLLATKRVAGAPVQRAMTVNAPGDEYEQEADSAARQVMSKSAQRSAADEEDESLLATKQVQRGMAEDEQEQLLTKRVQRAEDPGSLEAPPPGNQPPVDEKSAETKDKVTEADQKQKAPEGEKKEEEKKAEQKDPAQAANQAQTEKQGKAIDDKENKDQAGAKKALEAQTGGGPAAGGAIKGAKPGEKAAQGAEKMDAATSQAEQLGGQLAFDVVKPPDWDAETAMYDMFGGMIAGDKDAVADSLPPGIVQTKSGGFGFAPGIIMRDAASTPAPASPPPANNKLNMAAVTTAEATDKKDSSVWVGGENFAAAEYGDKYAVPKHENAVANMFVGDIGGKSVEVANTFNSAFASDSVEATGWGRAAAFFEGIVQITEVITNVLGLISLIMMIVAAILYGIGLALTLALFTAAAGAALIAFASTMMAWAKVLGTIELIITVVRMALRLIAITLRGIELHMIKDPEKLKRAKARMYDQAMGFGMDAVSVALDVVPGAASSAKKGAKAGTGAAKGFKAGLKESFDVGGDIAAARGRSAAGKAASGAVENATKTAKREAKEELAERATSLGTSKGAKETAEKTAKESAENLDKAKAALQSKKNAAKEAQEHLDSLPLDADPDVVAAATKRVEDADNAVKAANLDVNSKQGIKTSTEQTAALKGTDVTNSKQALQDAKDLKAGTKGAGLKDANEGALTDFNKLKNGDPSIDQAALDLKLGRTATPEELEIAQKGFGPKLGETSFDIGSGVGVGLLGGAAANTLKSRTVDNVSQNDFYTGQYKPYFDRIKALLDREASQKDQSKKLTSGEAAALTAMKNKLSQGEALNDAEKLQLKAIEDRASSIGLKRQDSASPAYGLISRTPDESPPPGGAPAPQAARPAPAQGMVVRSPAPTQNVVARAADEAADTELPPPPLDAVTIVDDTAESIAAAEEAKGFLQARLDEIDDLMGQKTTWQTAMAAGQGQLKTQKTALQSSDKMDDEQVAHAETGMGKAKEMQGPAKEAQSQGAASNGGLSSMQGPMDQGAEKAKEKGKAAPDPGATQGGMGKASEGGAQAGQLSNQAQADNQRSKNEALANKAQSKKIQDQTDSADRTLSSTQNKNQAEMDMMQADRQGVLNRLEEIEAQQGELLAQHDAALARTFEWTAQHKSAREAAGV